jgi:hypothetical protein
MELSIFLARFIGLYMLIICAIWLLRKKQLEAGIQEIITSKDGFLITGALHILVGLAIAIIHPIWKLNWQGLITLLGYFSIFQGVARLAVPDEVRNALLKTFDKGSWFWIAFLLIVGSFLTYHGFKHFDEAELF